MLLLATRPAGLGINVEVVDGVIEIESVDEGHHPFLVIHFDLPKQNRPRVRPGPRGQAPRGYSPAPQGTGAGGSSPPGRHQPGRAGNRGREATSRDDSNTKPAGVRIGSEAWRVLSGAVYGRKCCRSMPIGVSKVPISSDCAQNDTGRTVQQHPLAASRNSHPDSHPNGQMAPCAVGWGKPERLYS